MSHDQSGPPTPPPPGPTWHPAPSEAAAPQAGTSPPPVPTYLDGTPIPQAPAPAARSYAPVAQPGPVAYGAAPAPYGSPTPAPYAGPATPYGGPAGPYGAPAYAPAPARTDGFAIAALVFGLLGGLLGIVFGIVALRRIKRDGSGGRGMAVTGIVLGTLGTIASFLFAAVWLPLFLEGVRGGIDEATAPTTSVQGEDVTDPSGTELLTILPLEVDGLTATEWTADPAATGAIEAYTATFTDGTVSVDANAVYWETAEEADAWATAYVGELPAEALQDTGPVVVEDEEVGTYWVYDLDGTAVIVWTDVTTSTALVGPLDQADVLFQGFPI